MKMKKIILLTVLLLATVQFTFAQNTIAKLKFEEAEEAYANNNFELTLTKLKEVEGLLKSTNPRLMHLKILAKNKLIQQPKYSNDPELISQLNKDCALFFNVYPNAIFDRFKRYPNNIYKNHLLSRDVINLKRLMQQLNIHPNDKTES